MSSTLARALLSAALTLVATSALAQENIRGATTGPTTAPGFSHPEQYLHLEDVKPADNMYPVIAHPEQDKAALKTMVAKTILPNWVKRCGARCGEQYNAVVAPITGVRYE